MWVCGAFCRESALCRGMEHQGDGPCRPGQHLPVSHHDWVDNSRRQSGQDPVHIGRVFRALGKRTEFCPLPEGSEYSTYVNRVLAGLPAGVVNPIMVGNRKVLTGPAWAIPLMFHSTAQCTFTAKCSADPHPGA